MESVISSLPIYIYFKLIKRHEESIDYFLNSNNSISEYNLAMSCPIIPNRDNFLCAWRKVSFSSIPYLGPAD